MANYLCWSDGNSRSFGVAEECGVSVQGGTATVFYRMSATTGVSVGSLFTVQTIWEALNWVKNGERNSPVYGNELNNYNASPNNDSLLWLVWYCFFTGQCF